jgi:amino acid transporter
MPATNAPGKKLRTLQLAAIIFLTVSGGPYGLEPLLTYAGQNGALLLLMITPVLWDVPTIFVVLELNSMMPVTGGYYQWVKRALGMRWGFYEGWWTWLYTFVDLAIYPVLFVEYAAFFFPEIQSFKIPVCLLIIWASAILNVIGIVPVGKTSLVLGAVVITPFLLLFVYALWFYEGSLSFPRLSLEGIPFSSVGMALYTIMWNFLGWDNTTTYAGEVNKPVRSYILSIATAFALIFLVYFAAVFVAQGSGVDFEQLNEEGFPLLGSLLAGQWLGALLAAGGMASGLGLYSAVLLSVSRIPQVMSEDRLLPSRLNSIHPRFKTPYISIIVCSCVVSFMILFPFEDLLVIDVTLYGAAMFLEFISLIILRIKEPAAHRPFKIPFNVVGLSLMTLLPLSVYSIAIAAAFMDEGGAFSSLVFAVLALLSGEAIWRLIAWRKRRLNRL